MYDRCIPLGYRSCARRFRTQVTLAAIYLGIRPSQHPGLRVGADKLQTFPCLASRAPSRSLHPAPSGARRR